MSYFVWSTWHIHHTSYPRWKYSIGTVFDIVYLFSTSVATTVVSGTVVLFQLCFSTRPVYVILISWHLFVRQKRWSGRLGSVVLELPFVTTRGFRYFYDNVVHFCSSSPVQILVRTVWHGIPPEKNLWSLPFPMFFLKYCEVLKAQCF